jgi:hypothetical protein
MYKKKKKVEFVFCLIIELGYCYGVNNGQCGGVGGKAFKR